MIIASDHDIALDFGVARERNCLFTRIGSVFRLRVIEEGKRNCVKSVGDIVLLAGQKRSLGLRTGQGKGNLFGLVLNISMPIAQLAIPYRIQLPRWYMWK